MTISTNAQIVLKAVEASQQGLEEIKARCHGELSVPQVTSNIGVLIKKGFVAKCDVVGYKVTVSGLKYMVETGMIQPEPTVEEEPKAEGDYNEYTNRALGCIALKDLNIRIVETKTKVEYIRLTKNDHKIRAFEVHHTRNIFRIYTGQQLNTETHEEMVKIGAEIKEGTHWYYDFPLDYVTINAVIASL